MTETSEQTLRSSIAPGRRTPLHCVAGGKALLAALPPAEIHRYLDECAPSAFTPYTITDRDRLIKELAGVREQGFANSSDEYVVGISAIGATICENGIAIAAVSVAVPTARFTEPTRNTVVAAICRTAAMRGSP